MSTGDSIVRRAAPDSAQKELRHHKKKWNEAVKVFFADLKDAKTVLNGSPVERWSLGPSDIKFPLAEELGPILSELNSRYKNINDHAAAIIREQSDYAKTRRKGRSEGIEAQASSFVSRFLSRLGPPSESKRDREVRLSALRSAVSLERKLNEIEHAVLKKKKWHTLPQELVEMDQLFGNLVSALNGLAKSRRREESEAGPPGEAASYQDQLQWILDPELATKMDPANRRRRKERLRDEQGLEEMQSRRQEREERARDRRRDAGGRRRAADQKRWMEAQEHRRKEELHKAKAGAALTPEQLRRLEELDRQEAATDRDLKRGYAESDEERKEEIHQEALRHREEYHQQRLRTMEGRIPALAPPPAPGGGVGGPQPGGAPAPANIPAAIADLRVQLDRAYQLAAADARLGPDIEGRALALHDILVDFDEAVGRGDWVAANAQGDRWRQLMSVASREGALVALGQHATGRWARRMLLPLQRGTAGSIRKHILSSLRQAKGDLDTIQDVLEKSTDLGVLATGLTALQDALVQVGHGVLGLIDLSNAKGKKQMGAPSPQLRSLVRAWKAWELGQDMRENP